MKKALLFACAFISFVTITNAQITKGSILLGGNIGLDNGKNQSEMNNSKSNSIYFNPTAGIAIRENWIIGLSAGISSYNDEPTPYYSTKREEESYSGGFFVRRYSPLGKNFYLYGNGSINYNEVDRSEINSGSYENYYNSKGVTLSIAPGIAYAVNKRFHLEASFSDLITAGYTKSRRRYVSQSGGVINSNYTEGKNFGFATNINPASQLHVGFRIVLGK